MMLSLLTKRLCPLMSLALAFGCGKKINDPATSDNGRTVTPSMPGSSSIVIKFDESSASTKSYLFNKSAYMHLPPKLVASEGNAVGRRMVIFYNYLADDDYEFLCTYRSSSSATELAFVSCEDSSGDIFITQSDYLQTYDFPMDEGTQIKMQLINPNGSGLKINTTFEIEKWF